MNELDAQAQKETILMELLEKERASRVSPETQTKMEQAEASVNSEWMDVATDIQYQIVAEHNAQNPHFPVSVLDLRLAAGRHPEIAFWERFNRARTGHLKVGDMAPNVPLVRARDNHQTSLLAGHNQPCVVMAGSWS